MSTQSGTNLAIQRGVKKLILLFISLISIVFLIYYKEAYFMEDRDLMQKELGDDYRKHIIATTDKKMGILRQLANQEGYKTLSEGDISRTSDINSNWQSIFLDFFSFS